MTLNPSPSQDDLNQRLFAAVYASDVAKSISLCEEGARSDVFFHHAHEQQNAIFLAVERKNSELLAALLPHGDPRARDQNGATPLMLAVREEQADLTRLLLPVSNPWARDNDGDDALEWLLHYPNQKNDVDHPQRMKNRREIFERFAQINRDLFQFKLARASEPFLGEMCRVLAELEAQDIAQELPTASPRGPKRF